MTSRLAALYRIPITVFEHGACSSSEQPQSACINHAHIHLIPGSYNLLSEAPTPVCKYDSLQEFLNEERDEPHLMIQDPGGPFMSFEDMPTSQFFRRIIARRLGIPDHWDYAAAPFDENIMQTYKDFGIEVTPDQC